MDFTFDRLGNLTSRGDLNRGLSESFGHDNLNRLTHVNGLPAASYDAKGNILTKAGMAGSYAYSGVGAGPHAVTSAGGVSYSYNGNGGMTLRGADSVNWTAFNKVKEVWNGLDGSEFTHDTGHNRITQVITENNVLARKKVYVGGSMEQDENWNATTAKWETQETRIFIVSPVGVVGVYTQDATTPANTTSHYLFKDHLGSVVKVVDDDVLNPATVAEYSYDAWGKPRNATTWADDLTAWPDHETDRGFTGHEMLAGVELVHMNGRIYDPLLGRFLSADPFVQSPDNLQSYNRYSYVLNNPISFTDPSGFFVALLAAAISSAGGILAVAIKAVTIAVTFAFSPVGIILGLGVFGVANGGIGSAITVVFTLMGMPFIGGLFGSAIDTAINGGSIGDFLIGVAIGTVAGFAGGPLAGKIARSLRLTARHLATTLIRGAATSVIASTMSAIVYGRDIWKSISRGVTSGLASATLVHLYRAHVTEKFIDDNLNIDKNHPNATGIKNAVRDAGQSPVGQRMFSRFMKTGEKLNVFSESQGKYPNIGTRVETSKDSAGNIVTTNDLFFDGNFQSSSIGKFMAIKHPILYSGFTDDIVLLHELGHTRTGGAFLDPDVTSPQGGNVRTNENPYRAWLGLRRRTYYSQGTHVGYDVVHRRPLFKALIHPWY